MKSGSWSENGPTYPGVSPPPEGLKMGCLAKVSLAGFTSFLEVGLKVEKKIEIKKVDFLIFIIKSTSTGH